MVETKWQAFLKSGKISDYLEYKNELKAEKGGEAGAVYDKGTNNKGNSFW